ncbi:MAG TPA: hypothetical protein VGP43_10550, partial [Chitinophagaceae bacterium]|nr:hypothetical protein [Chitinophagaceae bacterium]
MKINFSILLLVLSLQVFAQSYPITSVITLPANPDASLTKSGPGTLMLSITASARLVNGRIDPRVESSKILVSIKKGGVKICGSYTSTSAPSANFTSATKVWSGNNAVSLLGQECTLSAGDYEFCVQFFGQGPTGLAPLSEEKCKAFTIKANEQINYQPPQLIAPANGTVLKETDLKKPITFRWTPLVPKLSEPVTYRIRVWQLMEGQNGTQAMKANMPIVTKDVENLTQTTIVNLLSGPCKPPYLCNFIWSVESLNREGKPIGENNGYSEAFQFSINSCNVNLDLKLVSIVCIPDANESKGLRKYKICVSSTYSSPTQSLTYINSGSGFNAYHPSYTPIYPITNLSPALQVQNSGSPNTANYCFDVEIPAGQTSIKLGLQGDDKDPGPIVCQPGAQLDINLPDFKLARCECGRWEGLRIKTEGPSEIYKCESEIKWKCRQPFSFSTSYQCNPSTDNCKANVSWTITKDGTSYTSGTGTAGAFTPTANGTYTITLDADCNGIKCKPCTYTIIVRDCIEDKCACGKWDQGKQFVIHGFNGNKAEEIEENLKCGDTYNAIIKGSSMDLTASYTCNGTNNCNTTYSWKIVSPSFFPSAFTTQTVPNFIFSEVGTYQVKLIVSCNGKVCDSCVSNIRVKENDCKCGKWDKLTVQNAAGTSKYACDTEIPWRCKNPFTFSTSYQCDPNSDNCKAKVKWTITKDGTSYTSGTGTAGAFTPTANGTYTITLDADCNGIKCKPCT